DVLLDISLQHVLRHAPVGFVGIELFLFQVEAIFAIEVANGPDRLGHHVEGGTGRGWCERRGHLEQFTRAWKQSAAGALGDANRGISSNNEETGGLARNGGPNDR